MITIGIIASAAASGRSFAVPPASASIVLPSKTDFPTSETVM